MGLGEHGILRHTAHVASLTLVSRILGYVRDRLLASLLGTSTWADAFYIAFRIPNTFRRFVAEGAMTAALVPVMTRSMKEDPPESAWLFARRFLYVFALLLLLLTAAGTLAAPVIARLMAWRYAQEAPAVFALTERLTAHLFPYLLFVSLAAVAMGILNSREIFAPSALAPALLNVAIITAALLWGHRSGNPTGVLAWAVLAGGALQFLIQVPFLLREGMSFAPAFSLSDPRVRRVFQLMVPAAMGAGVGQITLLVGTALAGLAGEGAVAALYYANRVTELAFGILAVSLATVIFPRLSSLVAMGDRKELEGTLSRALEAVLYFLLPATAGILALCSPIVRVLFETGRFSAHSVSLTSGPLTAYAAGMVLWGAAAVLVRVCHAHQDMLSPFRAGLLSLAVFVATALGLLRHFGAAGIAAASSTAALANLLALLLAVVRRHRVRLPWRRLVQALARDAGLSAAIGLLSFWLWGALPHSGRLAAAGALAGAVGAGALAYLGGSWVLGFPEARRLREIFGSGPSR
ncbi:MAG: murein biosynthesis integral membrane protein MurJ [Acidobacteriota bacterium]